mmetsp:Transcript_5801/g.18589  ORF Transcript_5801/g.18589 Transcript_5801/m.18589 type:complete len:366 (-) Transcript_5801:312-1409(-)
MGRWSSDEEGEANGVMDDDHKPRVPARTTGELRQALPVGDDGLGAPQPADMGRHSTSVDPVRVLSSLTAAQMHEASQLDVDGLADFFRKLGLRELPNLIRRNDLNGSVLHTVTAQDIERMDFHSLGEAKAFQSLCAKMSQGERGDQRNEAIMVRRLVFWGETVEWHSGPCSILNRCAVKDKRTSCERCCDTVCCSPKVLAKLPDSHITVYRDHISIASPIWLDGEVSEKEATTNRAWVKPNASPYKTIVDNLDFSNLVDVDLEETPKIKSYRKTCADCSHYLCCHSLRREPHDGAFYWVSLCQRFFGYNHVYKEHPEGLVLLHLREADARGDTRRIGVVDGASDLVRTILHHMEEAQIKKGLRIA